MPNSLSSQTNQPRVGCRRRWWLLAALLVGLVFLLWIGLLVRDGLAVRADLLALQDYAAALPRPLKPADIDMTQLEQRVTSLDETLSTLRSHAKPLLFLAPALGWLPKIGGDVQAAPALLDMTLELTKLGRGMITALMPQWPPEAANGRVSLPVMAHLLQALPSTAIASWHDNLDQAQAARQRIDTVRLSPWLRGVLNRYDEAYPLARTGLELTRVAPQLLGVDRPRTYLLLFQNEDELRATGGFVSAAGRATIDAGRIISLTVEDSYAVDDFATPYPDPPVPMTDYMGIDLWVFRDSNWSPDFPVAARRAISLYTQTRGGPIDGVIALNQRVVEALADGLGPLTIDGQTIANAQEMGDYMRRAWSPSSQSTATEWIMQRKNFISRAMRTLLDRLLNGGDVNWQTLGQALDRVLRSRDLLIALTDPHLNEPLHLAQLDGALRTDADDYLMVVDTNMGFNKANVIVQQAMQYTVTLDADRAPQAELTIAYTNTSPLAPGCMQGPPKYGLDTTYEKLEQECYWLYRRVLAPPGAELINASRHPTRLGELLNDLKSDGATRVTEENGKTVFGTFLIVPRGQRVDSRISYTLPASVVLARSDQLSYHLVWQKQPGAAAWPTRVTVVFPESLSLLTAQPQPSQTTANSATFQFDLDTDHEVNVTFKTK